MRPARPARSIVSAAILPFLLTAHAVSAQSNGEGATPAPASTLAAAIAPLRRPILSGASPLGEAPAPANADQAPPAAPPFTAGWRNGFYLQSADGQFSLRFRLVAQADGRFYVEDTANSYADTFLLRRLRPGIQGRVFQRFEFTVTPDYVNNSLNLLDAFLETRFTPAFRFRVGKTKSPFGLERLHSGASLLFYERAFPTAIVPNRDIGLQVVGDVAGGSVSYAAALLDGVPDGGSVAAADGNDGKEIVGRVIVRPVRGFGIGIAASRGTEPSVSNFATSSLARTFVTYTGATGDGARVRYSPQGFYYRGPFGAFGEYVHSKQPIRRGTIVADVAHVAWQGAASWVLTGENATEGGVTPRANVGSGGSGAFQVAARFHKLRIDPHSITLGLAAAGSSQKAEAFTVGLNWYLNPYVKYVVNFERTVFDDNVAGARAPENAVVFRAQLGF